MMRTMNRPRPATRSRIKAAFLSMLRTIPLQKVHITKLCQKAKISRATFYANYTDVCEVLAETIDDALSLMHDKDALQYAEMLQKIWDIVAQNDLAAFKAFDREGLPPPNRIIDFPRYHPLFLDDETFFIVSERIFAWGKKPFADLLMGRTDMSREEAENILRFLISGTLAVNRRLGWKKTDEWYRMQLQVLRFVMNGYLGLTGGSEPGSR